MRKVSDQILRTLNNFGVSKFYCPIAFVGTSECHPWCNSQIINAKEVLKSSVSLTEVSSCCKSLLSAHVLLQFCLRNTYSFIIPYMLK